MISQNRRISVSPNHDLIIFLLRNIFLGLLIASAMLYIDTYVFVSSVNSISTVVPHVPAITRRQF